MQAYTDILRLEKNSWGLFLKYSAPQSSHSIASVFMDSMMFVCSNKRAPRGQWKRSLTNPRVSKEHGEWWNPTKPHGEMYSCNSYRVSIFFSSYWVVLWFNFNAFMLVYHNLNCLVGRRGVSREPELSNAPITVCPHLPQCGTRWGQGGDLSSYF